MKKTFTLLAVIIFATSSAFAQNITNTLGTGGDFIINSTTGGILIPRMTITERDDITSPATGLLIFQTNSTPGFYYNAGTESLPNWVSAIGAGAHELSDLVDAKTGAQTDTEGNSSYFIGMDVPDPQVGKGNIGFGDKVFFDLTEGKGNIAIGPGAGYEITSGNDNILIGHAINASAPGAEKELNIGKTIYGTGIYGTSPKVGIGHGNKQPNSTLDVLGTVSMSYTEASGDYTLNENDYVFCATDKDAEITLPDATDIVGRIYIIKNMSTNPTFPHISNIGLYAHTGQRIDFADHIVIRSEQSIQVQSIGSDGWIIIGKY